MGRVLEIFVSSPGDLGDERKLVAELVGNLAEAPHVRQRGYSVRAHLYEDVVPPVLADGPQDAVNAFMMDPARCDVLVCLLGARLGTRVRDPRDPRREMISGTVYETTAARESPKRPRPEVLIYYKAGPAYAALAAGDDEAKRADRKRVEEFVAGIRDARGPLKGIMPAPFADTDDLREMLSVHLDATTTRVMRLYEARRRTVQVAVAAALMAVIAAGYGGWRWTAAVAHARGVAAAQAEIERLHHIVLTEPERRAKAAASLLMEGLVDGTVKDVKRLDGLGCGVAGPLIDGLGRLQKGGDLPAIAATVDALEKLAAAPLAEQCGCPELLSVLATENLTVRYCKSTHERVLKAIQSTSCRKKEQTISNYLLKFSQDRSLMSVLCNYEDPLHVDQLADLARQARQGPPSALSGQPPP